MQRLAIILVAVVALTAGVYLSSRQQALEFPVSLAPLSSNLVGSQRPDFRLGSSTGEFVTPHDFSGKTLLINFWATWCEPCRREMPMLTELQAEYGPAGLQVVGIALDDVQSVREFVQKLGINYPILVGETDVIETNRNYGNATGMLPYSVLVDSEGIIRWQYAGEIEHVEISGILSKIL